MSPEEELREIVKILDKFGIESGDNLGVYTVSFRVELLSRIASQQSVRPTLLESPEKYEAWLRSEFERMGFEFKPQSG